MKEREEKNTTFEIDGIKLLNVELPFKPGRDSLLLARLTEVKEGDSVLEVGSGCGFISLYLAKYKKCHVTGIDIFPELIHIAEKNAQLNRLDHQVRFHLCDVKRADEIFSRHLFNVIVSNPPYIPLGKGRLPPSPQRAAARHEVRMNISDLAEAARKLLKPGGSVWIAFPTSRLWDAIFSFGRKKFFPRKLVFAFPKDSAPSDIFIGELTREASPVQVFYMRE